jgi:hypothetical protein
MEAVVTQRSIINTDISIEGAITDGYHVVTIGDSLVKPSISFILETPQLLALCEQWIYELSAAYMDCARDEFESHFADSTINDLINGANAGGKK